MFLVEIEPMGVKQVYLKSEGSETHEDLCLATWPVVRKYLKQLNKALQKSVDKTLNKDQDHKDSRLTL